MNSATDFRLKYEEILKKHNELQRQLADARKDTERLDYLNTKVVNVRTPLLYGSRDLWWYGPPVDEEGEHNNGKSLREAIDAAREKESEERELISGNYIKGTGVVSVAIKTDENINLAGLWLLRNGYFLRMSSYDENDKNWGGYILDEVDAKGVRQEIALLRYDKFGNSIDGDRNLDLVERRIGEETCTKGGVVWPL